MNVFFVETTILREGLTAFSFFMPNQKNKFKKVCILKQLTVLLHYHSN